MYISTGEMYISIWRPTDKNNTSHQLKYTSFHLKYTSVLMRNTFHPLNIDLVLALMGFHISIN